MRAGNGGHALTYLIVSEGTRRVELLTKDLQSLFACPVTSPYSHLDENGRGVVSPQGLEPWTPVLKVQCSNQLS